MPPETTIFSPSSTVIVSFFTPSFGTNSRKPEVGFGVVGRKMLMESPGVAPWISLAASPVMNPIAQASGRGYWINTTSRKALDCFLSIVSKICLTAGSCRALKPQ